MVCCGATWKFCAKPRGGVVILDESQAIKNPDSQTAKAARLLPAEHRLCLVAPRWKIEWMNCGPRCSS